MLHVACCVVNFTAAGMVCSTSKPLGLRTGYGPDAMEINVAFVELSGHFVVKHRQQSRLHNTQHATCNR